MKTIVMDTSNTYLVVALYENDICIDSIQEQGNRKQSEYAILYLQQLLQRHQWNMLDVAEMVITIGPGSYTGVRVALTIAKTLAVTTPIRIKTVSSLAAYAGFSKAVSILDARSQKVFVGVFENGEAQIEEQMITITEFPTWYQAYADYAIVGDGHIVGQKTQNIALHEHMYQLAKDKEPIENVATLVPQYIKEVEAKKLW